MDPPPTATSNYTASDEQTAVARATNPTVPTATNSRFKRGPGLSFAARMVEPLSEMQRPHELAFSRLKPVYAEADSMNIAMNVFWMLGTVAVVAGLMGMLMEV